MTTLHNAVINCETGEVTLVPLTEAELLQREKEIAEAEKQRADEETKEAAFQALKSSAKAKLIAGEPLTEEEAAVIVL